MHIPALIITTLGGIGTFLSYWWVFIRLCPGNYFTHPFWLGLDEKVIRLLVVFQLLAAVGFIIGIGAWILEPPSSGIMGRNYWILPLVLSLFFVFVVTWAPATFYNFPWAVVLSLVGTAITSILLLAGSIEEDRPRWYIVLGLILLSIVTVLSDAVLWNAKYILTRPSIDKLCTSC